MRCSMNPGMAGVGLSSVSFTSPISKEGGSFYYEIYGEGLIKLSGAAFGLGSAKSWFIMWCFYSLIILSLFNKCKLFIIINWILIKMMKFFITTLIALLATMTTACNMYQEGMPEITYLCKDQICDK